MGCTNAVTPNCQCKDGHTVEQQKKPNEIRYQCKAVLRDVGDKDEIVFQTTCVLFDNVMCPLCNNLDAMQTRMCSTQAKTDFLQTHVGMDSGFDIVAVAKKNGFLRVLMMSRDDIDAATIDVCSLGV